MSGHNKDADIQRKVEYFKQLKQQAFNPKRPAFAQPKFVNIARRPGARGK